VAEKVEISQSLRLTCLVRDSGVWPRQRENWSGRRVEYNECDWYIRQEDEKDRMRIRMMMMRRMEEEVEEVEEDE
jgi:hypothetical protein